MTLSFLQKINWTVGLWRMWIVSTCLWIAFAYLVTKPIEKINHRNDPVRIYIDTDTMEFPSGTDLKVMKKSLIELVKRKNAKLSTSSDILDKVFVADPKAEATDALRYYSPPDTVWDILYPAILLALLPPIVILAVAYALGWIGRGFLRISN